MRVYAAFMLALALAVFQEPAPERHDQYKDDPHAYCYNPATSGSQAKTRQRDAHAHRCACKLMCQRGPENQIIGDQESNDCALFCTRSHCLCHQGEEPCEG